MAVGKQIRVILTYFEDGKYRTQARSKNYVHIVQTKSKWTGHECFHSTMPFMFALFSNNTKKKNIQLNYSKNESAKTYRILFTCDNFCFRFEFISFYKIIKLILRKCSQIEWNFPRNSLVFIIKIEFYCIKSEVNSEKGVVTQQCQQKISIDYFNGFFDCRTFSRKYCFPIGNRSFYHFYEFVI